MCSVTNYNLSVSWLVSLCIDGPKQKWIRKSISLHLLSFIRYVLSCKKDKWTWQRSVRSVEMLSHKEHYILCALRVFCISIPQAKTEVEGSEGLSKEAELIRHLSCTHIWRPLFPGITLKNDFTHTVSNVSQALNMTSRSSLLFLGKPLKFPSGFKEIERIPILTEKKTYPIE